MTFTDFVCLFLVVRGRRAEHTAGRPGGPVGRQWPVARPGGAHGRRQDGQSPAREHKNAVGRRECTGPQPFGQNTSLNPNSAQLK